MNDISANKASYYLFVLQILLRIFPADTQKTQFADEEDQNDQEDVAPPADIDPQSRSVHDVPDFVREAFVVEAVLVDVDIIEHDLRS